MKNTWVWKKATEKFRYKLYEKITTEIEEINTEIAWSGVQISTNSEYVPDYLNEIMDQLVLLWNLDSCLYERQISVRRNAVLLNLRFSGEMTKVLLNLTQNSHRALWKQSRTARKLCRFPPGHRS